MPKYNLLDTVVLKHDLPDVKLKGGDLGVVVERYEPDGLEVEFVKPSGETLAVVTLTEHEVRPVGATDIITVRTLTRAA